MTLRTAAVASIAMALIVVACGGSDSGSTDSDQIITIPGVRIVTTSTDEDGSAFFDGEDGEEIEVLVHHADGTTWDSVTVHYVDGDGYELFVAEDPLGRFLPSWAFFTQASLIDLTTSVEGMIEFVPDTDQFNAMVPWIEDIKAFANVRQCVTEQQLLDEADTGVALTSATLAPLSSLAAGVGTARNSLRFLVDINPDEPSEALFDVFEFQLEGIAATIRHYDPLTSDDCQAELDVDDTPPPSATPRPGQPTATPLPERPTDTPNPDQPTDTPGPQPTGTPGPGPTETPRSQPSGTPPPTPQATATPVVEDFMRIIDVQPPLGTTITENAIISVTVEFRVSSVVGVTISGLADLDVNLLSLGIHMPAKTQGTLKLQGEQFSSGGRLCAVSVTMEGTAQLASDSRGYDTPVC